MNPNPLLFILFYFPLTFSIFNGQAQDSTQLPIYVFSEQVILLESPELNGKRIASFAFGDTLYFEPGANGSCYHTPTSKSIDDISWYQVQDKSGSVGWVKADDVSVNMKAFRGKHHQVVFQSFCGDGMLTWRMGRVYDSRNKFVTAFADSIGFNKGFWMNQDQDFTFSDGYNLWDYNVNSKTVKRISSLYGDFFLYKKTKLAYVRTTFDCPVNATIRFGIIDSNDFVMRDMLTIDSPKYGLGEDGGEGEPNYAFSLIHKDGVDYVTFKITRFSADHYEVVKLYVNFEGVISKEEVLYHLR